MNLGKVVFAFFILLALTLNFGFFYGTIDNPAHHNVYEFFAAIVVNLIALVLKLGDRTHLGAVLLATSLVAVSQLVVGAVVWGVVENISASGMTPEHMASIVSLSAGAVLANVVSVVLLVSETLMGRR